jgi:hypothetical protein
MGQAFVLACEMRKGYPEFHVFAMGHMAEAEDELSMDHQEMADMIRAHRTAWQLEENKVPQFTQIVRALSDYRIKVAEEDLEMLNG